VSKPRTTGPSTGGDRYAVAGPAGTRCVAARADLVELVAAARRWHEWASLADRLARLRAWGVSVTALSVVVGVGESWLRVV